MPERLPDFIDPMALVEKQRQLKGVLPLRAMPELTGMLMATEGEARIELNFRKEGRLAVIRGRVLADLVLQCQCCLEPMAWPVESEVKLGIVRSIDEANLLPASLEPLLLQGETVRLADIVQEELLLAIPPIPQHLQCEVASEGQQVAIKPAKRNPFAVLSELKKHII